MKLEEIFILFYVFSKMNDYIFDIPIIVNSEKVFYEKNYLLNYNGKNYFQENFFPAYAKTSKMPFANRRGNHVNLEKRLQGRKRLKWK
jgi:hypothetical protein